MVTMRVVLITLAFTSNIDGNYKVLFMLVKEERFNAIIAEAIIELARSYGNDEFATLHIMAALQGVCPDRDSAKATLDWVYDLADMLEEVIDDDQTTIH